LKTIGCDGKDDGNLHKHLVISMRKLLLPICIVLAVAALVHAHRAQRKKCYEAQWVFVSSYASIGIVTNGVGEVVQPTGDELEAKTGYSRYNLLNITPTMIDGMQDEVHSGHRRKLLFARFVAEHDQFEASKISNAFKSVRYEMSRTVLPIATVSVFSESPEVALAVLSFWAETYCNSVQEHEARCQSKALSLIDHKIASLRKKGNPVDNQLLDEREALRKVAESSAMKTFTLVPPHIVNTDVHNDH